MITSRSRSAKAALALLVGLLVGGILGGGGVWILNRNKFKDPGAVGDVALAKAPELELVPADALGFAHVRLADLWRTESFAEFRTILEKAGPDAIKAFDESFVPAPSSADRLTVFGLKQTAPPVPNIKGGFVPPSPPPFLFGIMAFSAPFDEARVREANLKDAVEEVVNGKKFWADAASSLAVYFHSDRVIVIGTTFGMREFLARPASKDGPLANALALAGSGNRHLVAAMSTSAAAGQLPPDVPNEFMPLMRAESVAVGVVVGNGMKLDIRAAYKTPADAENAEKALRNAAAEGRKKLAEMKERLEKGAKGEPDVKRVRSVQDLPGAVGSLFGLGALNTLDEWLADPPLKRDGNEIAATFSPGSLGGAYVGLAAVSIGMLLPAVEKVREAASRMSDMNNLKQIGIAFHSYSDTYNRLPDAAWGQKIVNGRPTGNLSWRVALLPYLEHDALYRQFKLDEPWDSEHNRKLIPLMPKVYTSPLLPAEPGRTYYKVFTGPDALFTKPTTRYNIANIPDGSSNTLLVAEGGGSVTWTKPDDFEFDVSKPLPPIGFPGRPGFNALLADGSVRFVRSTTPEATLKLLIQPADGIPIPGDW